VKSDREPFFIGQGKRTMTPAPPENTAVVSSAALPAARNIDKVPFVELFGGRLQGVVSSGSDVERVYCAFIEAGSGDHYSSTNNNRPDAGLPKRLQWMVEAAVAQFGVERVARYLQVPGDPARLRAGEIVSQATRRGSRKQEPAGTVFSRFLNYLRFVELRSAPGPVPEMSWFIG
jgi:hypothetical protein